MSEGSERLKSKELQRGNGGCQAKKKEKAAGVGLGRVGEGRWGWNWLNFGATKMKLLGIGK